MKTSIKFLLDSEVTQDADISLTLVKRAVLRLDFEILDREEKIEPKKVQLILKQVVNDEGYGVVLEKKALELEQSSNTDDIQLEMDIAEAVQLWILDPDSDYGLELECHGCLDAGLVLQANPSVSIDFEQKPKALDRQKRSYFLRTMAPNTRRKRKRIDCRDKTMGRNGRKPRCCRRPMKVSFAAMDGFEHILQPAHFDAHSCHGRCPTRFNPANGHALLQSLMHMKTRTLPTSERISKPCCTASKLSSLPILHLSQEDEHRLEVTKWRNVVVGECKCS